MKVMDIVQPTNWFEENYAHMEYLWGGVKKIRAKQIQVKQQIEVKDESEEIEAEIGYVSSNGKLTLTWANFNY